jgi:hypothetical protein
VVIEATDTDTGPPSATATATAGADGSFSADVPIGFGTNVLTATAAAGSGTGYTQVTVEGAVIGGTTVLDVTDPSGDDNGPGTYQYPTSGDFAAGSFDITRFLSGYYDRDAYLLCPPHFLPNLRDEWYLERFRRNKWVLVAGDLDICRAETEHAARLLQEKGLPVSLHVWGQGSLHDWPEWRRMAGAYIP